MAAMCAGRRRAAACMEVTIHPSGGIRSRHAAGGGRKMCLRYLAAAGAGRPQVERDVRQHNRRQWPPRSSLLLSCSLLCSIL